MIAAMAGVLLLDAHLERSCGGSEQCVLGLRALPLALVMLLLIGAGCMELGRLAAATGPGILPLPAKLGAMLVGTWPFWRQLTDDRAGDGVVLLVLLAVVVMAAFSAQLARHRSAGAVHRIGATLLAVVYLGVCAALVLEIRMRFGVETLVLFLLAVKFTDMGAYFTGTVIGRHKIAPWLSPGKSWEGLIGGLALGAAAGVGFVALLNWLDIDPFFSAGYGQRMSLAAAAGFAAVVGLVGQAADMCESALKRDADIKDAGRSVPGFGGVLDVIDSPLLAAPVALIVLALMR